MKDLGLALIGFAVLGTLLWAIAREPMIPDAEDCAARGLGPACWRSSSSTVPLYDEQVRLVP